MQIIDPDGEFKDAGLDSFVEEVKLGGCGVSYTVTSIIGPQSSGKFNSLSFNQISWA